jgi:hypothetical protein
VQAPILAGRPGELRASRVAGRDRRVSVGQRVGQVARATDDVSRSACACEGHGLLEQAVSTFSDCVDNARRVRLCRSDGFPLGAHGEGQRRAAQARQALCAAGAGNQAQLDLGQRDAGAGRSHAVVAAHRQFEPAAHGDRMHGGDDRLGGCFEREDHAQKVGLLDRLGRAELLDVGAARERPARAGDHDRLHRRVVACLRQAIGNADAGGVAEAVDRRIRQGDDGDIAKHFVFSGHAAFLWDGRDRKTTRTEKHGRSFLVKF